MTSIVLEPNRFDLPLLSPPPLLLLLRSPARVSCTPKSVRNQMSRVICWTCMIICSPLCPRQPPNSTYIFDFRYANRVHGMFFRVFVVQSSYFRNCCSAHQNATSKISIFAFHPLLSIVSVLQNSTHSVLRFANSSVHFCRWSASMSNY